jgi:DNA oxidative demethylase
VNQIALFETAHHFPEGLIFRPEFLTREEESRLLDFIRTLTFGEVRMHGVVAKRRIIHFGLRYAFSSHRLSPGPDLPRDLHPLRCKVAYLAGVDPAAFAEVLVTEYPPGAGIGWHRDAPPFGIVAGVSLASACEMRFRRPLGQKTENAAIELPARSVYVLTGSSRNEWQHSISPMRELRYSLTFRTIK